MRAPRLLTLLRLPEVAAEHWSFWLKPAFNAALDIVLTERVEVGEDGSKQVKKVWTQGSNFAFAPSDLIYDAPLAYQRWADALKVFKFALQVKEAVPAAASGEGEARFRGRVVFEIMAPNAEGTNVEATCRCTCTQDEFVGFLISGQWPPVELRPFLSS